MEADNGVPVTIDEKDHIVYAPVCVIIGDTPTRQKLSGCRSHDANTPCREYLIDKKARGNLNFDTISGGRYSVSLFKERRKMGVRRILSVKTRLERP